MAEEKKLNDQELDNVAGGIGDLDLSGSTVKGNQTILDESSTTIKTNIKQDIKTDIKTGDIVGGNKTDVDTNTNIKSSIF